jgi:hypothetical protein
MGFGLLAFIFLLLKKNTVKHDLILRRPEDASIPLAKIIQDNWYFLNNEQKTNGPIKFDDLKKEFELGNITKKSFVWNETYTEWKKIEEDLTTLNELEKRS